MQYTIYKLECLANHRVYVGRTSRLLKLREFEHRKYLRYGTHTNELLQQDYNKYGADAFICEQLEVVEGENDGGAEKRWMVKLMAYDKEHGYNVNDPCFHGEYHG